MLEELLRELNNWFDVHKVWKEYTIGEDGELKGVGDFITNGQYFRILGSLFNDGVYKYPATSLTPETFKGSLWALKIPKELIDLEKEIEAYEEKYGEITASPYQSESFGGYSYSKKAGEDQKGWRGAFADKLRKWRKL